MLLSDDPGPASPCPILPPAVLKCISAISSLVASGITGARCTSCPSRAVKPRKPTSAPSGGARRSVAGRKSCRLAGWRRTPMKRPASASNPVMDAIGVIVISVSNASASAGTVSVYTVPSVAVAVTVPPAVVILADEARASCTVTVMSRGFGVIGKSTGCSFGSPGDEQAAKPSVRAMASGRIRMSSPPDTAVSTRRQFARGDCRRFSVPRDGTVPQQPST